MVYCCAPLSHFGFSCLSQNSRFGFEFIQIALGTIPSLIPIRVLTILATGLPYAKLSVEQIEIRMLFLDSIDKCLAGHLWLEFSSLFHRQYPSDPYGRNRQNLKPRFNIASRRLTSHLCPVFENTCLNHDIATYRSTITLHAPFSVQTWRSEGVIH